MFETTRRHLYLAGFMGTGKSAIGKALAVRLDWGFIDLDELIVSLTKRSISEVFATDGESAFRQIESRALRLAVVSPHSVIALGGGTPILAMNANIIRATGRCWLLTASWDDIWLRVRSNVAARPLLGELDAHYGSDAERFTRFVSIVQLILEMRQSAYDGIAEHVLNTSGRHIDELAKEIAGQFVTDVAGKSVH